MTQGLIGHHSMEAPTPGNNWKFNGFVRSVHKIRQPLKGELAAKKIAFDHELPAEDRNTLQSTQAIIKKETLPQLAFPWASFIYPTPIELLYIT